MLHLKIIGPDGKPIKASIDLAGDAIQFQRSFSADDSGATSGYRWPEAFWSAATP